MGKSEFRKTSSYSSVDCILGFFVCFVCFFFFFVMNECWANEHDSVVLLEAKKEVLRVQSLLVNIL